MATKRPKQTPASTSETLVSNYADKFDVRQERDKLAVPLAEQLKDQRLVPGRQTSPEVASLAGRILSIPKAERTKWVLAQPSETLAEWLVILAANALGLVNE